MENPFSCSTSCTNAFSRHYSAQRNWCNGLALYEIVEMARSAVILKTKLQSHPNSVFFPSNNEKRATQAQRNLLKRKRSKPEHKAPNRYIEVGISDSTGYRLPISLSTAAADMPRRSGHLRGQERCWRGIGDRNPLSLSNRPREEQIKSTRAMRYSSLKKTQTNDTSQTQFPYNAPHKQNVDSL